MKLQTPLFVADALMEAARVRLDAQTAAAKRELSSLESVRQQLSRFKVRGRTIRCKSQTLHCDEEVKGYTVIAGAALECCTLCSVLSSSEQVVVVLWLALHSF